MKFTTGPVRPLPLKPLPVIEKDAPKRHKDSIIPQIRWAYIINPDPVTIQYENEDEPLPVSPSTIMPVSGMLPYTKVLVLDWGKRRCILGPAKGGNPWVDCELEDGFAERSPSFTPQVMLDGSGLVDFRGQFAPLTGSGTIGSDTAVLELPDGYRPDAEQRWIGFPTDTPTATVGGYFSSNDGKMYIKGGSKVPTSHWCVIVAPWKPIPAQPY